MQLKELKKFYASGFVEDVFIKELEPESFILSFKLVSGEDGELNTSKDERKIYKSTKAIMNEIRNCNISQVKIHWFK